MDRCIQPEGKRRSPIPLSRSLCAAGRANANPTWLQNLHATLDRAVWDAYGWPADEIPAEVEEDVILGRLLALNLERSAGN